MNVPKDNKCPYKVVIENLKSCDIKINDSGKSEIIITTKNYAHSEEILNQLGEKE